MSAGIGLTGDIGWGSADAWSGAPADGVDVMSHANIGTKWHQNLSTDTYMFLIMLGALALLWILGGLVFKTANIA